MRKILFVALFAMIFGGCQWGARTFGGTIEIKLKSGEKLITATWKEADFWYLTRPMRFDEQPETYRFRESSAFGVAEGEVIIYESK